jgi:hypothetical protein
MMPGPALRFEDYANRSNGRLKILQGARHCVRPKKRRIPLGRYNNAAKAKASMKPKPRGTGCSKRPRRPPGRPQHQPTAELRLVVENLTKMGLSHGQTAKALGIARATLRRHYRAELRKAALEVDIAIGETFIAKALGGSVDNPDWEKANSDLLRFYLARRVPGWQKQPRSAWLIGEEFDDTSRQDSRRGS